MQLIKAEEQFNADEMHTSLLLYGFYCYHDPVLKNIVPEDIEWEYSDSVFGLYGTAFCPAASNILIDTQLPKYKTYYPDIEVVRSIAYLNIDNGVGVWHNDNREDLVIQAMCYQSDFSESDGGSLQIKCYDGIERHYYPKNGDVVVMNHATETTHKIDKILTDKKRIVVNMVMK